MGFRYYRRPWDELRGDALDVWGPSVWYFEVGEDDHPVRQVERYARGPVLRYSAVHLEDEYGGLGDQPLDREEFAAFEISKDEFEAAWAASAVNTAEPDAYNEVFRAVRNEDLKLLRTVIATGADVNAIDPRPLVGHMNTPLHEAANRGNAALVQILLDAGANIDARCADGWTPLMRACNAKALDVARLLVEAGADIHAKSREGYTAYDRIPGDARELLAFMESKGAR